MDLETQAREFATWAHASIDQRRKYSNEPYINHPAAVVEIVRSVPHTPEMLAAAWLHDVVEDTPVTLPDVHQEFGEVVATFVYSLTNVSCKLTEEARPVRKALDREHTAKASPEAKTIKLADVIDNTRGLSILDPEFARVYLAEKRLLLEVLTEGNNSLWQRAYSIVYQDMTNR